MKQKKELNVAIGMRLRQARDFAGYTQEKLAELVDVSVQYISDLERGVVGVSVPTLMNLCRALNASSDFTRRRKMRPRRKTLQTFRITCRKKLRPGKEDASKAENIADLSDDMP